MGRSVHRAHTRQRHTGTAVSTHARQVDSTPRKADRANTGQAASGQKNLACVLSATHHLKCCVDSSTSTRCVGQQAVADGVDKSAAKQWMTQIRATICTATCSNTYTHGTSKKACSALFAAMDETCMGLQPHGAPPPGCATTTPWPACSGGARTPPTPGTWTATHTPPATCTFASARRQWRCWRRSHAAACPALLLRARSGLCGRHYACVRALAHTSTAMRLAGRWA